MELLPTSLRLGAVSVVEVDGRRLACRVGDGVLHATLATPGEYTPTAGDTVLVGCADDGQAYVVGVVSAQAPAAPRLRHDPETRRTVLDVPEGDLVLRARGAVRLEGAEAVSLRAGEGDAQTRVTLDRVSLRAEATRIGVEAVEALAKVTLARVEAGVLAVTARSLSQTAEVIETRAQRVVERAHASYRESATLAQTRAAQGALPHVGGPAAPRQARAGEGRAGREDQGREDLPRLKG
ncbi:MAG: DUF3540 domain-containing protein [Polyangiales bacterium]